MSKPTQFIASQQSNNNTLNFPTIQQQQQNITFTQQIGSTQPTISPQQNDPNFMEKIKQSLEQCIIILTPQQENIKLNSTTNTQLNLFNKIPFRIDGKLVPSFNRTIREGVLDFILNYLQKKKFKAKDKKNPNNFQNYNINKSLPKALCIDAIAETFNVTNYDIKRMVC